MSPATGATARGTETQLTKRTSSGSGSPERTAPDSIPTSVYDVIAALDRLADALTNEQRAFDDGFKAGYADGYSVGHVHGERHADETWSWALGAIGIGKRKGTPEDRERLLHGATGPDRTGPGVAA